ncbi:hypothetical protein C8R46DRAFT_1356436 [Mycena filopes]|nr:hypothetical protein C8R46DRAFT_1356436 [Mycena filopes]
MSSPTPNPPVVVVDVSADASNASGIYQFNPASITAPNGTVVSFRFSGIPGNHSVTQSSYVTPCMALANGFDSGFMEGRETKDGIFPTFNFTVQNDQNPAWFFCKQKTPTSHCHAGMVGVINANANSGSKYTYDGFRAKALQSTTSSPSPSSSHLPTGAIVGAALGTIALLALCLAAFSIICRRRRRRRPPMDAEQMEPYPLVLPSQHDDDGGSEKSKGKRKGSESSESSSESSSSRGSEPETETAAAPILTTILREVRSLRRQIGTERRPEPPPPQYTVS